jgi:hypothetical protein
MLPCTRLPISSPLCVCQQHERLPLVQQQRPAAGCTQRLGSCCSLLATTAAATGSNALCRWLLRGTVVLMAREHAGCYRLQLVATRLLLVLLVLLLLSCQDLHLTLHALQQQQHLAVRQRRQQVCAGSCAETGQAAEAAQPAEASALLLPRQHRSRCW